jgi:hypothetical protein
MKPIPKDYFAILAELKLRRQFMAILGHAYQANDKESVDEMILGIIAVELDPADLEEGQS